MFEELKNKYPDEAGGLVRLEKYLEPLDLTQEHMIGVKQLFEILGLGSVVLTARAIAHLNLEKVIRRRISVQITEHEKQVFDTIADVPMDVIDNQITLVYFTIPIK